MQSQELPVPDTFTITLRFVNGQSRKFRMKPDPARVNSPQQMKQTIRRFLKEGWWIIESAEQTYFINSALVTSFDLTPPTEILEGEGVLHGDLIS
jgi:hypothetical protein